MSISLKDGGDPGQERGRGRLDEQRLRRMAHIRAEATGESIEQVLSVFTGTGRHGTPAGEGQDAEAGSGPRPSAPALAPVIELGRGRRRDRGGGDDNL
jgi:hypothetical protein